MPSKGGQLRHTAVNTNLDGGDGPGSILELLNFWRLSLWGSTLGWFGRSVHFLFFILHYLKFCFVTILGADLTNMGTVYVSTTINKWCILNATPTNRTEITIKNIKNYNHVHKRIILTPKVNNIKHASTSLPQTIRFMTKMTRQILFEATKRNTKRRWFWVDHFYLRSSAEYMPLARRRMLSLDGSYGWSWT